MRCIYNVYLQNHIHLLDNILIGSIAYRMSIAKVFLKRCHAIRQSSADNTYSQSLGIQESFGDLRFI